MYRFAALLLLAVSCLCLCSCGRKKDGVFVEVSDDLAKAGAAIRDWRKTGAGALDVLIYSETPLPANSWTLAFYDKDDKLMSQGNFNGPRIIQHQTIWLRFDVPDIDLLRQAERIVVGNQPPGKQINS
jgi:hypothetical protein